MKLLKTVLLLMISGVLAVAGSAKNVFPGEISDTQCAMNVHSLSRSHQEMIAKKTIGTDPASCAKACVRRGGEWVLRSGDKVYRLKNQSGVEDFAGKKVKVSGTLDPKTGAIDNFLIEETTHGELETNPAHYASSCVTLSIPSQRWGFRSHRSISSQPHCHVSLHARSLIAQDPLGRSSLQ